MGANEICGSAVNACDSAIEAQYLLQRLARGDDSALWPLVVQVRGFVYRRCLLLMRGNQADAEDALGLAILRLHRELPPHAVYIRNLEAWLTRLTRNLCVDILREQRLAIERIRQLHEWRAETDSFEPSSERIALDDEVASQVRTAIGCLPGRLRETARQRFLEGADYDEIATCLGITEANARKRVQSARRDLLPHLERYLDLGDPLRWQRLQRRPRRPL